MFKTILVHVDGGALQESRLRAAIVLAQSQAAHLVGIACTGISWFDIALSSGSAGAPEPLVDFDRLRASAAAHLRDFEEQARRLGAESVEGRLADDLPDTSLDIQARYADLVVLSQETGPPVSTARRTSTLPEQLALRSPRPILIVPSSYHSQPIASNIVVGWDGSIQALHAITAALPLLVRADAVKLVLINPDKLTGLHGEEPGADMALYLARHAAKVDIVLERTSATTGNALMSITRQYSAGLIVMGVYGHSRYREWILGGTTRELLERAPVPLLVAH